MAQKFFAETLFANDLRGCEEELEAIEGTEDEEYGLYGSERFFPFPNMEKGCYYRAFCQKVLPRYGAAVSVQFRGKDDSNRWNSAKKRRSKVNGISHSVVHCFATSVNSPKNSGKWGAIGAKKRQPRICSRRNHPDASWRG